MRRTAGLLWVLAPLPVREDAPLCLRPMLATCPWSTASLAGIDVHPLSIRSGNVVAHVPNIQFMRSLRTPTTPPVPILLLDLANIVPCLLARSTRDITALITNLEPVDRLVLSPRVAGRPLLKLPLRKSSPRPLQEGTIRGTMGGTPLQNTISSLISELRAGSLARQRQCECTPRSPRLIMLT